ncbi:hypothetical protein FQA47_016148 [Oryzias melastigma]|uniref:Uncharacterized protein n=1 Tax=Oryzias melastigma TaxID=30732 RepID=A0A834FTE6_ORYME|nr:hypothetical protein FQA47_016148 [Oryzias melastigma]
MSVLPLNASAEAEHRTGSRSEHERGYIGGNRGAREPELHVRAGAKKNPPFLAGIPQQMSRSGLCAWTHIVLARTRIKKHADA